MRSRLVGSVLVVEDSQTRIDWFRQHVPQAHVVTNPTNAVAALSRKPDVVFLDFDLGRANSLGVAHLLADDPPALCIIHSANEKGAAMLKAILPSALVLPFASFIIEGQAILPRR